MTTNGQHNQSIPAHIKMELDGWVVDYKDLLAYRDTAQVRIAHLERQLSESDAARRHAQEVSTELVKEKRELMTQLLATRAARDEFERERDALHSILIESRRVARSVETIASVTAWANETFGQAEIGVQIQRAANEFDELLDIPLRTCDETRIKLAEEAADVCICLYRVIGTLDPEAIDKKMAKNRARKWRVDGQGCAQHVGEE